MHALCRRLIVPGTKYGRTLWLIDRYACSNLYLPPQGLHNRRATVAVADEVICNYVERDALLSYIGLYVGRYKQFPEQFVPGGCYEALGLECTLLVELQRT